MQIEGHAFNNAGNRIAVGLQVHGPVVHVVNGVAGLLDAPVVGLDNLTAHAGAGQHAVMNAERVLDIRLKSYSAVGYIGTGNSLLFSLFIRVDQLYDIALALRL